MDEQRVAAIRERAEKASIPDAEQMGHSGYLGYDVDGIPVGVRYAFGRHEDYEFVLHARADVLALLAALAAREAEAAQLKAAIERVDEDANKRGEHTRQGAPSQAHSFTRGMKCAISLIRDYDEPSVYFPALAAPPPGDGAGGRGGAVSKEAIVAFDKHPRPWRLITGIGLYGTSIVIEDARGDEVTEVCGEFDAENRDVEVGHLIVAAVNAFAPPPAAARAGQEGEE